MSKEIIGHPHLADGIEGEKQAIDAGHEGLRILARIIAQKYLQDTRSRERHADTKEEKARGIGDRLIPRVPGTGSKYGTNAEGSNIGQRGCSESGQSGKATP